MYSLAERWFSSGCLDFACTAWQNIGYLQNGSILDDRLGRALVIFRCLNFAFFMLTMLGFCMYILTDAWISSVCLDFA